MNRRAPLFAVTLLSFLLATTANAADDLPAQLDAMVAQRFAANQPGAVVLVKRGDAVLLRKAYGMANLELAVPMRPEYIFRVGSITKQFTATAIMMLVDAGKLRLQDDIRKYVPAYPSHGPIITIEHLLTHTSGIPSYTDQNAFEKLGRQDVTHDELLAVFKDLPLQFQPGEKWEYSNTGYYLLGMIIEKISGQSYARFLDDHIFKPLQMTHSSYEDHDRIIVGRAAGYERDSHGTLVNAPFLSMRLPFAAGALISSVDDLALWDAAIAAGRLLSAASWKRMFTPEKLKSGQSTLYGFAWGIDKARGVLVVEHGGSIPGFNAEILRMPAEKVLVVVLCNSLPAPSDPKILAQKLAFLTIGKPIVDPVAIPVAAAILDRYVGVYKIDDTLRLWIRRQGDHLVWQRSDGTPLPMQAESETSFFVQDTPLRWIFVSDKAGKVIGLDVRQPDGRLGRRPRTDEPLPNP